MEGLIGLMKGFVTGLVIGCTGLIKGRSMAGLVGCTGLVMGLVMGLVIGLCLSTGWVGKRLPAGFLLLNKATPCCFVVGRE